MKNNFYPTVMDYRRFLACACQKFGISENEARNRYGLFSYAEWCALLEY